MPPLSPVICRRQLRRATISSGSVLHLDETSAQEVILVRAVEETDPTGTLLSHRSRQQATEIHFPSTAGDSSRRATAAREAAAREAAALAARAQTLLAELDDSYVGLPKWRRWSRLGRRATLPVMILGGLFGLAAQGLGSTRQISILAVPLMALVVWNVGVLLVGTLARIWLLVSSPAGISAPSRLTAPILRWWQGGVARRLGRLLPTSDDAASELLRRALERFLTAWGEAQMPLVLARLRRLLHAGSMAVVVGTVGGMYGRGLVREYRVSWESTFLSGQQVDALLGYLLAPASWLLGRDIPSVATYPWPETFDAAPFIHLWAATALLFVIVPRTLFWLLESWNVSRLERRLTIRLPQAYRRRLRSAGQTVSHQLDLWPYSYQPSARSVEQGQRLLLDVFGSKCQVSLAPSLTYGDGIVVEGEDESEDGEQLLRRPRGRCIVVLFNLAQTPENEVHGELLRQLQENLASGQSLVVWVDTGPYRRRLEGDVGASRLDDKRRAWERLLNERSLQALFLDLESPQDDDLLRFDQVAWPPGNLGETA